MAALSAGQRLLAMFALLCSVSAAGAAMADPFHPLDPLSAEEIARATEIIAGSGRLTAPTRVATMTVNEPDKDRVLGLGSGSRPSREALAVLRVGRETYEAVVDLDAGDIRQWRRVEGVQPQIQSAEWALAQRIVKADAAWRDAMAKRGYTAFENIFCEALSAGYFGKPEEEGRRLVRMPCYDVTGARVNVYARPIEGVVATVDLDAKAVVALHDAGVVPVPASPHDFEDASYDARQMRSIQSTVPEGRTFTLNERRVEWGGWSFRVGFDERFGLVLSLVSRRDGDRKRLVLYQGHVSEIFVPYMHDAPAWAFRTYLDAGEFGLGALSSPLVPGADCPTDAAFLDAVFATSSGQPHVRERVICIFVRDTGEPLWRHHEALTGVAASRPAMELVVRAIPSVAHYDYIFDWVFTEAGAIRVRIGATGIDSVEAVHPEAADVSGSSERRGAEVAAGLRAINHDHFFSLRLDLDVDGPENRIVRERLEAVSSSDNDFRRSFWRTSVETLAVEGALTAGASPEGWRIENPGLTTPLGQHPAYQIEGCGPVSLLDPTDWAQRRAAFSSASLWVTRRRPGELFAAGAYPNQSSGGEGLPAYANEERIDPADLVAWCTIGFHHVTRPEDWPVLTTKWREIELAPHGFFDRNPALR